VSELVFYQIPISHFCEKIHWALDYKGVPYTPISVNPFTRRELEQISTRKQVPVIRHGDQVVCDSSEIVRYLDDTFPHPPLVPQKEPERNECLEIEKIADEEIGPAVRRVAYEAVFEDQKTFSRLMLPKKGLARLLNPVRRPVIKGMLKWHFGISRKSLTEDKFRLDCLLVDLQTRLDGRSHFVGDSLTIADIAVASLLNPLEIVADFSGADDYSAIFAWMRTLRSQHGRRGWKR
jgi:glutathione S-transferase